MAHHLLEVRNLSVRFHTAHGIVDAVKGRQLARRPRRDPRHPRRVGLRQVGLLVGDPQPDRLPAGRDRLGRGAVRRPQPARHVRRRAPGDQRQADRDDLPGPAQPPEPGLYRRLAAQGGDAGARHDPRRGRGAGPRAPAPRRHPRARRRARQVPAPVLRRPAPADHDRHGAGDEARHHHRRRADDRARRHRAGRGAEAARGAAGRDGPRARPHHPRSRRRRRGGRPGGGDERRRDRRGRHPDRDLPPCQAPLHQEADRRRPRARAR